MLKDLLRKLRKEKDYSLDKLAKKIDFSRGYLHNAENGTRKVSVDLLDAYIKEFPEYKRELVLGYLKEKIPQRYWEILK